MRRCSCDETGWPNPECGRHGLPSGKVIASSPLERHRRSYAGESTADAQWRLYLAAASDRVRVRAAGFSWPLRRVPPREGLAQR